ncbi:MAG: ribokinase [Chloroflexi bacterium]|nr:ribokinase [Chloroflexota bacterium]
MDYLAIGHIAQDITPNGLRLGGTVAYSTLAAHALGLQTGILTSAAPDAITAGLESIAVHCAPSPLSTVFENRYTPTGRIQTLHAQASLLSPADLPSEWTNPSIVHLAPIACEVDPAFAAHFAGTFIGLTPQGWMRRWDASGRVTRGEWAESESLLRSASATVISVEDVGGDWNVIERWASQSKAFVATQGDQGATVFWNGDRRQFPAPAVPVADLTGAGDIFAAAFFVRLQQSADAWDAARFAVDLASESVTRVGVREKTRVRSQ